MRRQSSCGDLRSFIEGEAVEADGLKPKLDKKMVGI
jgi:hypothetical protein